MKIKNRYPLVLGLVIAILELFIFCLGHFASMQVDYDHFNLILFLMSLIAIIFCFLAFKASNFTTEEMKKKWFKPWGACIFTFLYWTYLLVVFCLKEYNNKIIAFAHLLILGLSIFLMIIGNTMKILNEKNKISYKNQNNQ